MRAALTLAIALIASGCVRTSVMPLAQDTIEITTNAAPVCGESGAQNAAVQRAAVETIRHGFDRFVILNGEYQNTMRVVGTTPVIAQTNTYGTAQAYGNTVSGSATSTTTYSGGYPIIAGGHRQALVVKMFKGDDPQAANALDAKFQLGPDWQLAMTSSSHTCLS
jgi:hypothetical protein